MILNLILDRVTTDTIPDGYSGLDEDVMNLFYMNCFCIFIIIVLIVVILFLNHSNKELKEKLEKANNSK